MPRRPPAAALHTSPDEVEAQFYEALQRGDIESLMGLWADDDEIVCVHPGSGVRLVGAVAIRASFEAIFANGGIPVLPQAVHRLNQLTVSLHHLVERIDFQSAEGRQTAWVLATNVYLKTAQGWRLAAHHASPAEPQAPGAVAGAAVGEPPGTLH
jgi:ketosteroid isomerase-like protein